MRDPANAETPRDTGADDREARVDAAIAEYLRASPTPDPFDRGAWLARHPDVADELAAFLRAEAALGGLGTPLLVAPACNPEAAPFEPTPAADLAAGPPPELAEDYELVGEIGRGGMGVVYEARQRSLTRSVALKMLLAGGLASGREIDRFHREAEAAAALDHPNIVPIYEVGEHAGRPFFAMKLLGGGSLAERGGSFRGRFREVAGLTGAVARAVHHAHQRGVLHRDLKPSNILLDERGVPHVSDFGLARRLEGTSPPSVSGAVAGTPAYMAPEQVRGERGVSVAADVYGLGGILYHLLTGVPPFRAASAPETLLMVLLKEPVPPRRFDPATPRDLETVCLKCLEKDPDRRYPSAAELADELDRWVRGEPILARPAGRLERAAKWVRRNPGWAAAAGVVVLSLAVLAVGSVVAAALFKGERDAARANEARATDAEGRADQRAAEAAAANQETRRMLFDALRSVPGEVRAMRLRGERGAYFAGMPKLRETLARARDLGAPPDIAHAVRNEMLNLLTAPDVTVDREWGGWVEGSPNPLFDPALTRYAALGPDRTLTVYAAGGGVIQSMPFETGSAPGGWFGPFSPDGRKLLGVRGGPDPRLFCWPVDGRPAEPLWERPGWATAVFTPDSRWAVVSGKRDGSEDALLIDAETGREVRRFERCAVSFGSPFHPSRPWLALERPKQPVWVVNYQTGERVGEVGWLPGELAEYVCWHPSRPVLAAQDRDRRIRLVEVPTGRDAAPPLAAQVLPGLTLCFDRTGDRLVSWDTVHALRVWDLGTGCQTYHLPLAGPAGGFRSDPEGDDFLVGQVRDGKVQVLRIRPGEGLRVAVNRPDPKGGGFNRDVYPSPDGRLVVAAPERSGLRFADPATAAELGTLAVAITPVAFERSGALLTYRMGRGVDRWPVVAQPGGRVTVGPPTLVIGGLSEWMFRAGASADGRVIAVPRPLFQYGVRVYHLSDLSDPPRLVTTASQPDVRWADVSPDGRWVLTGSEFTGGVWVSDADTGKPIARLQAAAGWGVFSPGGDWVAVHGHRGSGKLVRAGTWEDHLALDGRYSTFSPDGRLIAVGEGVGVVRLLECETGREVARLEVTDPTRLMPAAFSPDGGRFYAAGEENGALYIWDLRHLRARLKEMAADWDWPEYPPAAPVEPVTAVEILSPKN